MNISGIPRQIMRFVGNNSPAILTGVGVAGVLTTAVLTAKATFSYMKSLSEEGYFDRDYTFERTPKEHFQNAWKLYIPPAVACFATVTAIVCSNRIEYRRAAAVAAAYAISERGWEEYKAKIVERLGPKKEQAAQDEVAQDRVTANPPSTQTIILGEGDSLCMDLWSGRYFRSTMEKVKTAMAETNAKIYREDWASLTSFYEEVGLKSTQESDNIGWNKDHPLDLRFSFAGDDEGHPVMCFSFRAIPFQY
jgi:hypothetical protein